MAVRDKLNVRDPGKRTNVPWKFQWLVQMYFLLKQSLFKGTFVSFRGCTFSVEDTEGVSWPISSILLTEISLPPCTPSFPGAFRNTLSSTLTTGQLRLLMAEIRRSPVEVGSLSHYLQGFIHPRWCRISSINSMSTLSLLFLRISFKVANEQTVRSLKPMTFCCFKNLHPKHLWFFDPTQNT